MSERKDKEPIKDNMPQEEAGQEVQEVIKDSRLYDMEVLDKMTPEELQAAIEALPPEQRKEYQRQNEEAAKALIKSFRPVYQSMKDYDKAQKDLRIMQSGLTAAAQTHAAEATAELSEAARQQIQIAADTTKSLTEAVQNMFTGLSQNDLLEALVKSIGDTVKEIGQQLEEATKKIMSFYTSDSFKAMQEALQGFSEWYNGLMQKDVSEMSADDIINLGELTEDLQDLLPYIQEETAAYKKETGKDQITVKEFFRDADPETGEPIESIYSRVLQRAQERAEEDTKAAEAAKNIVSIGAHRVKELPYPIDKVNESIWGLLQENTHGQLAIKAESQKSKKQINIIYSIDFDNIDSESPVLKRLTQYDKRVYIAAGGLCNAGNYIVTISMIYQAMGYKGEPGKADRDKINKSLTKMGARIYLDNWQEINTGYKYPPYKYDGPLLPFERITPTAGNEIFIDGRAAEEYIHFFREPPLIEFARGRKQVTTIDIKLLQTPLNKTEQNIAIEDYCIERIAQYKREGKKILLSTLYKKCNITTRKQQERAPEKIRRLFDYYKECGEITKYTLTDDAITFDVPKPTQQITLPIEEK